MEPAAIEEHLKQVEEAMEEAKHLDKEESKWLSYISLSTAIIAIVTALAGLYEAQVTSKTMLLKNEAVLYQAQASDQWSFYQAKGVKGHLYEINAEVFPKLSDEFTKKAEKYKKDQEKIKKDAQKLETIRDQKSEESEYYYEKHHILSFAITFLQISIALASISALTRNKQFWLGSLMISVIGATIGLYTLIL
jgi:hypothetical protein